MPNAPPMAVYTVNYWYRSIISLIVHKENSPGSKQNNPNKPTKKKIQRSKKSIANTRGLNCSLAAGSRDESPPSALLAPALAVTVLLVELANGR